MDATSPKDGHRRRPGKTVGCCGMCRLFRRRGWFHAMRWQVRFAHPTMRCMANSKEQIRREFPVVVEQAIAWGDMDACQHVNNAVYFRYFENARLEYFRRLDWFRYEDETGVGPIISTTQARYRRPLTYPDTILIGARLVNLEEDRFTLEHRLVSELLDDV